MRKKRNIREAMLESKRRGGESFTGDSSGEWVRYFEGWLYKLTFEQLIDDMYKFRGE